MCLVTLGIAAAIGAIVPSLTAASAVAATTAAVGSALGATAASASLVGAIAIGVGEIAIAGAVAGGTLATVSAVQQAEAAQEQAEFQAKIEAENARLAAIEAEDIELQANQDRAQLRLKMLASRSEGRTGFAAGGVVLGSGTAAEYEADIADAYDLDKRNLNYDVAQKRWQAKMQSVSASNQSSLYAAQASGFGQQKVSSIIGGVFKTTADTVGVAASALNFGAGLGKLSKEAGWGSA